MAEWRCGRDERHTRRPADCGRGRIVDVDGGKRTERELATEGGYGDYLDKAIHGWIFMPCRGSLFGFKSQKKDSILKVRTNAGVSHWTLLHLIPAGDQYNSRGQAQRRPRLLS